MAKPPDGEARMTTGRMTTGTTDEARMTKATTKTTTNPVAAPPPDPGLEAQALEARKASVLRAIVEQYVSSGAPVGSQTIVQTADLGVSAATVRNDMSALEREGYITHPHTSAGRIPTDRGYRFFVDHFAGASELPSSQRREVADFFASTTRVMDELLHSTSQLLARLTDHTALVVGPHADVATVRSVQLVSLQPRIVMAVAVLSNGAVEKETLLLADDASDTDLDVATRLLHDALVGLPFAELRVPATEHDARRGPTRAERLAAEAFAALRTIANRGGESVFVGGTSHLAAEHGSFSPASLSRLLELLEQQVVIVAVVRELLGPGLTVRIGAETEREDLVECSIVLAPYIVEGQRAGTVGVLGPTRMDYRQAQAAVTAISRQLTRSLPQ
jgi:heat-inducible transcriptional repressor